MPNGFEGMTASGASSSSNRKLFGWIGIGVLIALAVAGVIAWIEKDKKDKNHSDSSNTVSIGAPVSAQQQAAAAQARAQAMAQAQAHAQAQAAMPARPISPDNNAYADRTPDLATEDLSNELYGVPNPAPYNPQPTETDYSSVAGLGRQATPDDQWAPKDMMTQNEALSQANAENAQWFSGNLLPNADLQCSQDGMVTDGPTYEELAIFTPRLMEASIASRYFMDPPVVNKPCGGSDILRPRPLISSSAGSRENLVWGISSIQQSDLALQNAAAQSVFCLG